MTVRPAIASEVSKYTFRKTKARSRCRYFTDVIVREPNQRFR
jgi:hypothetical protein